MAMRTSSGVEPNKAGRSVPAEAAKLEKGDVILQIDDVLIEDDNHLVNVVNMTEVGKEISLVVYRNGQQFHRKTAVANLKDFSDSR